MVEASKAVNENITVGGSAEITNAFADAREIALGADAAFAYAPITLYTAVSFGVFGKDFEASADVEYAAEKFTAKAGVVFGTTFGTDDSSYIYASAWHIEEVFIYIRVTRLKVTIGTYVSLIKKQANKCLPKA